MHRLRPNCELINLFLSQLIVQSQLLRIIVFQATVLEITNHWQAKMFSFRMNILLFYIIYGILYLKQGGPSLG
jgi:hypothetical protein